jgi:predicted Na+-dependent transporter
VLARLLSDRFWITAYAALALGFLLPGDWQWLRPTIPVFLGGILYFSCLKITLGQTAAAASSAAMWWRLAWLNLAKLLVIPLAAYAVTLLLAPAWAPGILLLAMMPAGFASLAFADLLRGDRITTLLLLLTTSALVPLTAPLLLAWMVGSAVSWTAIAHEAGYIAVMLVTPFVLAQLTRISFPTLVARHFGHWNHGSIASACLLVFVGAAVNRHSWAHLPALDILVALALTILATAIAAIVALSCARFLPRQDAIAFTCVAIYMNNGLAMAFATEFHPGDPHMLLPTIVVQIPIMIGVPVIAWIMARNHRPAPGSITPID